MKITAIRSDRIYRDMMTALPDKKENIYRNQLMKPFEFKWACVGIPLTAAQEGGYDVVSAATMSGFYAPVQITEERQAEIEKISSDTFWASCEASIRNTLLDFEQHGIQLPKQEYVFTVMLSDPQSPMTAMTGDYCGDGGIPGYIIGSIVPNERSLGLLPVALAHETNHNVRWQFIQWSNHITLADMIVSEGLAETFAAKMFGEDKVGKWVSETTPEVLRKTIKPLVRENLEAHDFQTLSSYLYGDEIMSLRGGQPIGMPYCGGYACGYALIGHYLKKKRSIYLRGDHYADRRNFEAIGGFLEMKVSDVAKLTGVTVRTLHYYDEIGLLPPSEVTSSGYRVYNDADLEVLQQILFFRELDFSLEEIRGIMQNPAYEKETALQNQKALLVQKRDRLDRLIALVDKTLKGECDMSFKQFDTTKIEEAKQQYAAEVKQRWGNTVAYAEYEKKSASYNTVQQKMLDGEGAAILNEFGKNRSLPPDSVEVQELVKKWQAYITDNYYNCTKEILSCLGQMYVGDERFTQHIDQYGVGTAAFMAAAIEVYTS
ncbi:DUF2268 domain-containing putative Zn-dependent protease [Faecalibacterium prausnitzii]